MACPYYQEPAAGRIIGRCNHNPTRIPSETHQNCLCRSHSGVYVDLCPVYVKFEREKSCMRRQGIFKRVFVNGYRKLIYNDEIEA